MKKCLDKLGTLGGYVGAIICVVAVFGRFYSLVTIQGYNAKSILICGIGIRHRCICLLGKTPSRLDERIDYV